MKRTTIEDIRRLAGIRTLEERAVSEIARDIRKDWKAVNYAAKPYLDAMMGMDSANDEVGADSGRSVINYFLSNASSYRGPKAKELKAELKALLKGESVEPKVEAEPDTARWEAEMAEAQKILHDARDKLTHIKKKMKASAPSRDHMNKFGPVLDKAINGVEDALDGFTY